MKRRIPAFPAYRRERETGRAYAQVNGEKFYFGPIGSPESHRAYAAFLVKLKIGIAPETELPKPGEYLVKHLLWRYIVEEFPRYSRDEQHCINTPLQVCWKLFGETPVSEFGPLKLRVVRDEFLKRGAAYTRRYVNEAVKRLRRVFKWGVSWEIVPPSVLQSLQAVASLKAGESGARESRRRRAIPEAELQAVRSGLAPLYQDVFDLLLLTGSRPGEILGLTPAMIDRSGAIWRADLQEHKTKHFGKSRVLFFNAAAQAILAKYLQQPPNRPIFDLGKTTFCKAMIRACEDAYGMPEHLRSSRLYGYSGVKRVERGELTLGELSELRKEAIAWRRKYCWSPHWLRHTTATKLVDTVGVEAAQQLLGHSEAAMTRAYSTAAEKLALQAAATLGDRPEPSPNGEASGAEKLFWTLPDVLRLTGLPRRKVQAMIDAGTLPAKRVGNLLTFDPLAVKAVFIEQTADAGRRLQDAIERQRQTAYRRGQRIAGRRVRVSLAWTPAEDAILRSHPIPDASRRLGRTRAACRKRLQALETMERIGATDEGGLP